MISGGLTTGVLLLAGGRDVESIGLLCDQREPVSPDHLLRQKIQSRLPLQQLQPGAPLHVGYLPTGTGAHATQFMTVIGPYTDHGVIQGSWPVSDGARKRIPAQTSAWAKTARPRH